MNFHLVVIDTDPVRPDPDRQSLDGDPDADPAKNVVTTRTGSGSTTLTSLSFVCDLRRVHEVGWTEGHPSTEGCLCFNP